ncbi:hypothetical protein HYDPIDRAFT_29230 [Hydnomerulius pinastri MD-312]|uniref:Uncharacterized protein n=1 Tax=Hydnomerulius pinastri MD-312 TaxID=994086 RepID=A0A0C9WF38_9AGAM|nr:hypothetical protein HYDPIDRAFT_29230 [Hydnomerulius pinastri MD-312]
MSLLEASVALIEESNDVLSQCLTSLEELAAEQHRQLEDICGVLREMSTMKALKKTCEGYSVYDPHEPRKKIGKVIKVKPRQPGEIDDGAVLTELGKAIATLEADSAAMIKRAEEYHAELQAALIKIQQDNSALTIYEAIEKEMVELTVEQTRAMDTFKVATD